MRCVLTTEIPVIRVAVFAEMAWMQRRPELALVCQAAREQGNRMTVAVVQSVIPGLPDAGATNVIAWCTSLRLCDRNGGLTAMGEDVASSGEAPVPEQGVYGLWLAEHPVLGRRVLAAERLSSNRNQTFESILPLTLEPDRGKVFASVLDLKERFMVRDLPSNHGQRGCIEGETQATCRLSWTLDFDQGRDQWQIDGKIEAPQGKSQHAMQSMQHQPESAGLDLWRLASAWSLGPLAALGRWQEDIRRLAVAWDRLADAEADTFRKTFPIPRVEVPGKGAFEAVTLEGVPIGPASAADAQKWAMARFHRRLSSEPGYRSREEVRQLFVQLTDDTPLEAFGPTLPSHDDLLQQASKDPERFWSLAAPVDLSPFPVGADELGAFSVGSAGIGSTSAATESSRMVRIPYRGGWTMRRLVDRLLSGVTPRRVLLCDRYVRGDANLEMLRLLQATLRKLAPDISVEVWTHDERADFKMIQSITGAPPRNHREVFGQKSPHDRYILVLPMQGQGFGWHMSHSPLHARADLPSAGPETPLRWQGLLAVRFSSEELEPAFRQWLLEGRR